MVALVFFSYLYYDDQTKLYLNHSGLRCFFKLLNFRENVISEILSLCNFFRDIKPLLLFLRKYKVPSK